METEESLEQLRIEQANLREQLHNTGEKMERLKKQYGESQTKLPTIICPKCEGEIWSVKASYNPFRKIAWERRDLTLTCVNCGFAFVEYVAKEL